LIVDLTTISYIYRNPLKKLPAMSDDGFLINESHTILRYIADKYANGSSWYPADLKGRAAIDMYLDWSVALKSTPKKSES
jgi:glutathione S-transferase